MLAQSLSRTARPLLSRSFVYSFHISTTLPKNVPVDLSATEASSIQSEQQRPSTITHKPTKSFRKQFGESSISGKIRKIQFETVPNKTNKRLRQALDFQVKRFLGKNMSSPPFNDLTYYTFGTPNGLKPAIVLEELGLTYKCEKVDISKNTQKEEWFLEINPNGRIPALKDGDMRVFESGAIMLYLADCYDKNKTLTYEHGSALYYELLSWLMFQMGGLGPMQGQANHFRAMAGARSDYGIKRYIDETKRLYSVLEIRLSKADWLAGDKYTLADIANYSWVRAGPVLLELDLSEWPGVEKWVKRIDERPAVKKALNVPPSTRSPEEMKEMFTKMRAKIDAMENTDKH